MLQSEIDTLLNSAKDEKYREFNAKIVNTKLPMIGVRTPYIKSLAKQIARENAAEFLDTYKAENFEQILLYSFVIAFSKLPIEKKFDCLDKVLPLYDNWAHIDMTVGAFKDLAKHKDEFMTRYARLITGGEFERRFMVIFLMNNCLTENELANVFALYEKMQCDFYYVNMGIAWALSVALVKFYEQTLEFLDKRTLNDFILRKTVQKARESYRITPARKAELKERYLRVIPSAVEES